MVGLGYFAQAAVLPAFRHARNAELVALVSDDAVKRRELGRRYRVATVVDYDGYDELLASGAVDAVYLTLPNDLHAHYAIRAAKAGIHVLTEKPMALTPHECRRMVSAARRHDVRLMVAYRLHFEAANMAAVEAVRNGTIGTPRLFNSVFTMQVKPGNIRTKAERGGGPLYDIGIYCLNAARYLFRAEPTHVFAATSRGADARFKEVDETVMAVLRFPGDRLASFTASFGVGGDQAYYTVMGTKGYVCVDPAFEFAEGLGLELKVGPRTTRRKYPKRDQVAPELMHFADCVLQGKDPEPSGREGLIDVEVIQAIQRSVKYGREVPVRTPQRARRPTRAQAQRVVPHGMPELVHADVPHQG